MRVATPKCSGLYSRIGRARSDSSITRPNARTSSSLVNNGRRPTLRLRTWKTIPCGEYRWARGMPRFYQDLAAYPNFVAVTPRPPKKNW